VLQVRQTSSNSGMYLCLMQGNACGRRTLGVMFPPGYRVSNYEGYKQGSTWLRMQKLLRQRFIMQSKNWLKGQYCKRGHEMQSQFNAKKYPFLCHLVYLV
jgi:hypothetical protein